MNSKKKSKKKSFFYFENVLEICTIQNSPK